MSTQDYGSGRVHTSVVALCQEGNQALKTNDFSRARRAFSEALDLDGRNMYALVGMGDSSRKSSDLQGSIRYYEQALEWDPDNPFALRGLGDACRGLARHSEALAAWGRYLQRNPTDYFIYTRIGDVQKKISRFVEAENAYLRALELHPNDKFALMGLADLYYKMGREDEALAQCHKLQNLGEVRFINIFTIMGNIYRRRADFENAEKSYRKALELESRNNFALFGLAEVMRGQNRYEDAIQIWFQVLEDKEDNENVLARIGDCYFGLNDMKKAEQYYLKSNSIVPNDFAKIGLLRIRRKQKEDIDSIISSYEDMFRNNPDGIRIASDLIDVYLEHGRKEKCHEVIKSLCHRAERDRDKAKKLIPLLRDKISKYVFGITPPNEV